MSFLRPASSVLRSSALRPALSTAPRACLQARFASSQGYGDGKGDPVAEDPQKQGKNPSESLEHPGPAPPKVARGKSSSPDEKAPSSNDISKSDSSSSQSAQKSSGGNNNNKNNNSSSSSSNKGTKGAQPKILNENPPNEDDPAVRQHNKEMDNRAEKAHERVDNANTDKDKVSKGFWAGQGGRDRDP